MALTLMDKEDFKHFSKTVDWIKQSDHTINTWFTSLCVLTKTVPGLHVFPYPQIDMLFRLPDAPTDMPYALLILCTGNQVIQLIVPHSDMEEGFKRYVTEVKRLFLIPHPKLLGPGKIKAYNWSGHEIVRDETFQQTIASDQIKEEVLIEGFNEVTGEWDVVFKYDS